MTSNALLGKAVTIYNKEKRVIPVLPVYIDNYIRTEKKRDKNKVLKATIIRDAVLADEITFKQFMRYFFDILQVKKMDISMAVYKDDKVMKNSISIDTNVNTEKSKKNIVVKIESEDDIKKVLTDLVTGKLTWDSMIDRLIKSFDKIDIKFLVHHYDDSVIPINLKAIRRAK